MSVLFVPSMVDDPQNQISVKITLQYFISNVSIGFCQNNCPRTNQLSVDPYLNYKPQGLMLLIGFIITYIFVPRTPFLA